MTAGSAKPSTPLASYKRALVDGYPVGARFPAQPQPIGSLLPSSKFPQNAEPPKIFAPLEIRGVTFPNRFWVAPMCQYSSDDGHANDYHLVHIGSMAMRGWGNIMIEATAVVPEGRITEGDAGLWKDSQIEPLKRQVDFVHATGGKIGIQLAHAGRKASTLAPWVERLARDEGWKGGSTSDEAANGWADGVYGPSAVSFHDGYYPNPIAADDAYIANLKKAFAEAVERCKVIGFDFIEIHGAHGYLIHEFFSPLSNKRTDNYGGSLENRMRLALELTEETRKHWDKPLFFRVSATDWLKKAEGPEKDDNGDYHWWGIEQTTILAQKLKELDVDLLDVSSGGNDLRGNIPVGPSYQVPLAQHIKERVPDLLIGAVGLITESVQANDILEEGKADVAFFARELLRNIDFPLRAAQDLGAAASPAVQYERMVVPKDHVKAAAHHKGGVSQVEGEEGSTRTGRNTPNGAHRKL